VKRRSKARALALQILYAWEMREGEGLKEVGEAQLSGSEAAEETRAYARRLLAAFDERRAEIDALLEESTTHWELKRLSVVDRNVLRLATCELLAFPEIPFRVAIDEAVNLARRYGGDDSPRFVNGVLDALRVRLQGASA
jgi:N utilization substance protein B